MLLKVDLNNKLVINDKSFLELRSIINFTVIGIEPNIFIYFSNGLKIAESNYKNIFFCNSKFSQQWYNKLDYELALSEVNKFVLNKS